MQHLLIATWIGALALLASGCGGDNTPSSVPTPGRPETGKTQALEVGAKLLQDKPPIGQLNAYLDGFHFYNGKPEVQMEAHHYCGHLNQDVIQCVIYDGNLAQAKLIGVEYIISKALFTTLPSEEKHLWHSHVHEVRSGQLIAPGIPAVAEHELMEEIAGTYGKTWHTWHTGGHTGGHTAGQSALTGSQQALPLGTPMLMMGFTQDGQLDEGLVAERDARFGVSSAEKRRARADIAYPPIDPEADAWQRQIIVQLQPIRESANGPPRP
jgi:hypothetical protein